MEEHAETLCNCLSSDVLMYENTEKLYGVLDFRCPKVIAVGSSGLHSTVSLEECSLTHKFIVWLFIVILLKLSVMLEALRFTITGPFPVQFGLVGTEKRKQKVNLNVFV